MFGSVCRASIFVCLAVFVKAEYVCTCFMRIKSYCESQQSVSPVLTLHCGNFMYHLL